MNLLRLAPTALALALTMIAPAARAQAPTGAPSTAPEAHPSLPAAPPAVALAPPAGYAAPHAGYAPPAAGYAPPPGDSYPPAYVPLARVPVGPATLPYESGYPIPAGYHPERRTRTGLVIAGAVTFSVAYALPAIAATYSKGKTLAIPIAGPFIDVGRTGFSFDPGAAIVLVVDGLAQAAGVAMLIAGVVGKRELVRDEVAGATVRVTPMGMGYGGMGIGIVGEM